MCFCSFRTSLPRKLQAPLRLSAGFEFLALVAREARSWRGNIPPPSITTNLPLSPSSSARSQTTADWRDIFIDCKCNPFGLPRPQNRSDDG